MEKEIKDPKKTYQQPKDPPLTEDGDEGKELDD